MTLTGRAAEQRPDVDLLAPVTIAIATHTVSPDRYGSRQRATTSATRADTLGHVDSETGAYRNAANAISETDRRSLGLRRNGRPRRR